MGDEEGCSENGASIGRYDFIIRFISWGHQKVDIIDCQKWTDSTNEDEKISDRAGFVNQTTKPQKELIDEEHYGNITTF